MLPCCIFGALVIVQLLAFSRWFRRAILRKPPKAGEEDLWSPERSSLRQRMERVAAGHGRKRLALIAVAGEAALFGLVYALGGFDFLAHLAAGHGH